MDYLKLLKWVKSDKYLRVILVAISFFPKLIMLDDRPLWIDEAWRANLILNPNFLHRTIFGADEYTAITSPGFALFAKLTTLLTDTSPSHLRLVSLLSGVFLTLLTYEIVRKYDRRLAFTASIYISFGTPILNASLEFKQYLLESVIQALLIFLIVIRIEEKKLHNGILPVAAMIGIAFSPTVLFLVPILFIVDFKYNTRKSILISSWLCAAFVTVLFFFISWRHATTEEMLDIWGLGFNQESNLNEIVFQFQAILFTLRGFTTLLLPGIPVLLIFYLLFYLLFLFVSSKFHRKNVLSIVALSLISYSTIIFANLLHKWPVGDLRNNLFIKTNCLIIFFLLVSQIKSALVRKQISYFLIGIFLTVNFYGFDFNWKRYGPPIERSDLALSFVVNDSRFMNQIKKDCLKKKTPMIFTTNGVEDSLNFYNNYNSSTKNDFNQLLNSCVKFIPAMNLKTLRIHFNELSKSKSNAFLIYTHYSKQEQKQVRTLIATYFPSASHYEFDSAGFSTLNSS